MLTSTIQFLPALLISMLLLFGLSGSLQASSVTPNHVYQSVDNAVQTLDAVLTTYEASYKPINISHSNRKPRHVLQKGREVFLKLQQVRELNSLPAHTLPEFPVRKITPADVKQVVEFIRKDTYDLLQAYDVVTSPEEAPLPSNMKPTEVYLHLVVLDNMLSGLNIPKTVPNDVYQVALTIHDELVLILEHQRINANINEGVKSANKKPSDVYQALSDLMLSVKSLCQTDSRYCIEGGIDIPPMHQGNISPAIVLDLMNNLIADIGALKVSLGIQQAVPLAPEQSGKTPSDVFDILVKSSRLMARMS